uniref:Ig-like domain-containing protein n=1 Tax=Oryzias latipes TaxID=8090 RepID=A0A3P9K050_ORYLA
MFASLTEADGPFTAVTWNVNTTTLIINYLSDSTFISPDYQDRITFFPTTASLELRNLTLDDGGQYSVTVNPDGRAGTINVDIYVPLSSVTVTRQSADLLEFSSFSLTCSSSGSSLSFIWMNSSSEVTGSDRVQITDGGSTLTVVSVTRYDEQSYKCRAFNPVSEGISENSILSALYGPQAQPILFYQEGSEVSLSCSADSKPSAQFSWFLNGTKLPDSGPELTLRNIQISQRGDYSCQAFNSKILTNEMSPSFSISVIEGSSVTLTCEASGSSPSRKWKKDASDLSLSENVTLSNDNKVLTFRAVNKDNSGEYVCLVSNPVSSSEAKFTFIVNYGPQNLICSAESSPSGTFTWRLNGSEIIGSSAEFLKEKAQSSDSGTYTCEALNTVTKKQATVEHELNVQTESISNVTLKVTQTGLVEFRSSALMTCSVSSGSSLSFLWTNGSSVVTVSDRVQLSNGSSTLRVLNLTRFDSGPYRCSVSNPVSNGTSNTENVTINGPDNMALSVNGQETTSFAAGSNLSMLCSAESNPAAQLQWAFKGELVNSTGTWLKLINVSENQTGSYSCLAFNNNTSKYNNITRYITISSISDVLGLSLGSTDFPHHPKIFYVVEIWRLARPLQDLKILPMKPLLCRHCVC